MGKPAESVNNAESSRVDDTITELTYEDKLKFVSPISKPMASKKLTKKICKLLKKAAKQGKKSGCLRLGIKDVQRSLRRREKGLLILAGDVRPIDMISHFPAWCEELSVPYCYLPSRTDLGTGVGRFCSILAFINEHPDYKDAYEECYGEIKTLPISYSYE